MFVSAPWLMRALNPIHQSLLCFLRERAILRLCRLILDGVNEEVDEEGMAVKFESIIVPMNQYSILEDTAKLVVLTDNGLRR